MVQQLARLGAISLCVGFASCSMQPMIDASLPPPPAPAEWPVPEESAPASTPAAPAPAQPATAREPEREIAVRDQTTLSPAAASLVEDANAAITAESYPTAISKLERANKIAPRAAEVYLGFTRAYAAMGQQLKAAVFAKKTRSLNPGAGVLKQLTQLGF